MVFNIGIAEPGFYSLEAFVVYVIGNVFLMIAYWSIWVLYFQKRSRCKQMLLAIIPTILFLLNGIAMRHYLLILSAIIFGTGHIYVTLRNS
jgi:hypothetical protein